MRNSKVSEFDNKIATRLALALRDMKPSSELNGSSKTNSVDGDEKEKLKLKNLKQKIKKDGRTFIPVQTKSLRNFQRNSFTYAHTGNWI